MKYSDCFQNKILVLLLSFLVTGIVVATFFLDRSLEWGLTKICICVFVNLWVFTLIPSLRNSYLFNAGKPLEEWLKMGLQFGASGIAFPVLFAPYFGMKYYFSLRK